MSQKHTKDEEISLRLLSKRRRLLKRLIIIMFFFAVYLMVVLMSFNPQDPSWSQTAWDGSVHNLGGKVGAWLSYTLLFIFGIMAYTIPPILLGLCCITFRYCYSQDYIDYFAIALRLIGMLALVLTSCGLAALNADDIWYFVSGGVVGSLMNNAMSPYFNAPISTLILLFVWAAGLTLYTDWSWLIFAEKIGAMVMGFFTFTRDHLSSDK